MTESIAPDPLLGAGYRPEGYLFLHRALRLTQVMLAREGHVSGTELLEGFRLLALQEFGPMARTVLEHWGVRSTDDVGRMVRALVETGGWGRRDEDSWEEFHATYDFARVFDAEYPWNVREALNLPAEAKGER
jgi:uncharacterized repeat protein (TIGR04138 family)